MAQANTTFAAIDVGTTKICAIVGRRSGPNRVQVLASYVDQRYPVPIARQPVSGGVQSCHVEVDSQEPGVFGRR